MQYEGSAVAQHEATNARKEAHRVMDMITVQHRYLAGQQMARHRSCAAAPSQWQAQRFVETCAACLAGLNVLECCRHVATLSTRRKTPPPERGNSALRGFMKPKEDADHNVLVRKTSM